MLTKGAGKTTGLDWNARVRITVQQRVSEPVWTSFLAPVHACDGIG